jgi:hypothetical protein
MAKSKSNGQQITAKALVVAKNVGGDARSATVQFQPDYQDERNKEWAVATPSLSIVMGLNGDVAEQFETGQAWTLTFELSDDQPQAREGDVPEQGTAQQR